MTKSESLKNSFHKKAFIVLLVFLGMQNHGSFAQFQYENFDSYLAGDSVTVVAPYWKRWGNAVNNYILDALISSAQSKSGQNSLNIVNNTDIIYLMGNKTAGTWIAGFSLYIPSGNDVYYNIQEDTLISVGWMLDVFLNDGGTGLISVGGNVVSPNISFPHNQWFDLLHEIDLDNDTIKVWIDSVLVYTGQYTLNAGTSAKLGSLNFYGGGTTPQVSYYLDDMFKQPDVSISRSFENRNVGDSIAVVDPFWRTWNGIPGSSEDAVISSQQAKSGTKSLVLEDPATNLIHRLGNQTAGLWRAGFSLFIGSDNSAYYNIQENETPGVGTRIDAYFNDGGTGTLEVGGMVVDSSFTFPHDQWFEVDHYVDLDHDSIQVWIDGLPVYQGQYTLSGGTSQIGGFNFRPSKANGPGIQYYLDDLAMELSSFPTLPVGLYEMAALDLDFNFYPNPASNEISISNPLSGSAIIRILDAWGTLKMTQNFTGPSFQLDISNLEAGLYFIEIQQKDQRRVKKLIVE